MGHRERGFCIPQEEQTRVHSSLAIRHLIRTSSDLLEMDILCGDTD